VTEIHAFQVCMWVETENRNFSYSQSHTLHLKYVDWELKSMIVFHRLVQVRVQDLLRNKLRLVRTQLLNPGVVSCFLGFLQGVSGRILVLGNIAFQSLSMGLKSVKHEAVER